MIGISSIHPSGLLKSDELVLARGLISGCPQRTPMAFPGREYMKTVSRPRCISWNGVTQLLSWSGRSRICTFNYIQRQGSEESIVISFV